MLMSGLLFAFRRAVLIFPQTNTQGSATYSTASAALVPLWPMLCFKTFHAVNSHSHSFKDFLYLRVSDKDPIDA